MNLFIPFGRGLVLVGVLLFLCAVDTQAFTVSLQEQGSLTGFISGGGGTVVINQIGVDHWLVGVQDSRIGNSTNPNFSLAFIEPETVAGFTAYNNVQVLNVSPGVVIFDVLSDEISPYSTIVPNGSTAPIQNTDIELISMKFTDVADSIPEPSSAALLLCGATLILMKRTHRMKESDRF